MAPPIRLDPGALRPSRRQLLSTAIVGALLACTGCGAAPSVGTALPAGQEGLVLLAQEFFSARGDLGPLLGRLRPVVADFDDVFVGETVLAAIRHYDGYWLAPRILPPTATQSEFRLSQVTTEELVSGAGAAATFPGPYRDVAPHLRSGLVVHRITFHEPGIAIGIDIDGFVHVNGSWRLFPTPWLVLGVDEPGHQH